MVFAAGLGTRMRSHRSDIPKPLVPVAGKPIIDHVLDRLVAAGVRHAVVNISWMGEMLANHLAKRQDIAITLSPEDEPLETGGGIVKAMPHLGNAPFFALNSDSFWIDGTEPALHRLARAYDEQTLDALLLACPTVKATGYSGRGDFILFPDGRLRLRRPHEVAPFVFGGVQILHPRIFAPYVSEAQTTGRVPVFSLNRFFKTTQGEAALPRIRALAHDSSWMHIGDGDGVREAEALLQG
jgi:MurNAc alpha-1-phosphate uridylyltransferase